MPEQVDTTKVGSTRSLEATPAPLCALCRQPGRPHYVGLEDRHFEAPGSWSLLECPDCELMWLDPRPATSDLEILYSDYYTHEGDSTERASLFERGVRLGIPAVYQGYRDRVPDRALLRMGAILGALPPLRELAWRNTMGLDAAMRGTLLDVGCGDGAYLETMSGLGWQVSGVERDAQAVAAAEARVGVGRIHAELADAREARADGYDVITLSHVIEHVLEPIDFLRDCRSCTKPGGSLVVATPNLASRGHAHFGRNWLHLDPPRHTFLYQSNSLEKVVERAGFRVERIVTPSSSAHFVWRASREIARSGRLPGIRLRPTSPIELLQSIGFWAYEYALTVMGRRCGEELMLIARNPG